MSHQANKGDYLSAVFQWLSTNAASYERVVEAFEAECEQEEIKLAAAAENALLHPEDRAVGCVAFGRVEMLRDIITSMRLYKPK